MRRTSKSPAMEGKQGLGQVAATAKTGGSRADRQQTATPVSGWVAGVPGRVRRAANETRRDQAQASAGLSGAVTHLS